MDVVNPSAPDDQDFDATCLGAVLPRAAQRFGQAPALFFEGRWSSFTELDQDSSRFADALMDAGVGPATRVVLHIPNSRDWVVAYYGAAKTGAVVVPVDAMLTHQEVTYIIQDCGASVLITGLEDLHAIRQIQGATDLALLIPSLDATGLRACDIRPSG